MTTNQEGRQAAIRDSTSTAYGVAADWNALFDDAGISAGTFNERLLAWINAELSASYSNLVSAMQAYAEDAGYDGWEDMATLVLAMNGAETLLDGETQGLAFDFTDQSALIIDTGTPANNYDSTGIVSSGSLVGPSGKLTYTSPSNKLTRQSDGYYKYQAHNLLSNSTLAGAVSGSPGTAATGWSFVTVGTPSVDAVTALETGYNSITITCDAERHVLAQTVTTIVGATYSVETDVVADGNIVISQILGLNTFPTTYQYYFNDVAKTLSDTPSGAGVIRLEWTATATSHSFRIGAGSSASCTGTVTVSAPLFRRTPSNSDKIRTTTSGAKYALPLEYDTSGNCLGLLVEEARTNTQLRSTNIALAAGYYAGAGAETVTANAATSPSGLTDASSYVQTGVTARIVTAIASGSGHSIVANSTNTFSIFAKKYAAGTNHWLRMTVYDTSNSTNQYNGWFNLNTGAIGSASSGGTATGGAIVGMKDVGNGWYRCSIRGAVNNSATFVISQLAVVDADTSTTRASGDGCYLWGWQFESGSFPTSPIITYGAAASRLVDDIKIATTAMPWSSTAMSSMAKWTQLHPSSGITSAIIGADGDYIIYTTGTAIRTYDGTSVASSGVAAADNTTFQAAASFENGVGQKITVNGETTQTASFDGTMGSGTSVWIGNRNVLTSAASKIISKILMVPRAKTTAELESDSTQ